MANIPEAISSIQIGEDEYTIDALTVGGKSAEDIGELVTSIDGNSTDSEYPSAKCVYTIVYGNQ